MKLTDLSKEFQSIHRKGILRDTSGFLDKGPNIYVRSMFTTLRVCNKWEHAEANKSFTIRNRILVRPKGLTFKIIEDEARSNTK